MGAGLCSHFPVSYCWVLYQIPCRRPTKAASSACPTGEPSRPVVGVRAEPHSAPALQMAPALLAGKGLCVASMST